MKPFLPDDPAAIKRTAEAFGLFVLAISGILIWQIAELLGRLIGYDWSYLLVSFPAFFLVLVFGPISMSAEQWLKHRSCVRSGGHYMVPLAEGSRHDHCGSCGYVKADLSPSTSRSKR